MWSCSARRQALLTVRRLVMETHFYSAHLPSDEEQSSQRTKPGGSQPPLNPISLGNPQTKTLAKAQQRGHSLPSFRRTRLPTVPDGQADDYHMIITSAMSTSLEPPSQAAGVVSAGPAVFFCPEQPESRVQQQEHCPQPYSPARCRAPPAAIPYSTP